MFCFQCEQAAKGVGCSQAGVCGKTPEVADLQDLLIKKVKGIAFYANIARAKGNKDSDLDNFVMEALFATVTNVNFDKERIASLINNASKWMEKAKELCDCENDVECCTNIPEEAVLSPENNLSALLEQAKAAGVKYEKDLDKDLQSVRELLLYGLKGMASYAWHAEKLDAYDDDVYGFTYKALAALTDKRKSLEELVSLCMECGKVNIRCMEILHEGHCNKLGVPEPANVFTGTRKGKAIIVTGHDLLDLEELLKQTEGKGINIYTHGEMLPAHAYPGLKKYPHLIGNYGGAWQDQQKEFDNLPAAILFTTNCIQKPRESYSDRVFTTGTVGWPGATHIDSHDYSKVIEKALSLDGFDDSEGVTVKTGFAHEAVLSVADTVIDAVKSGAIRHFFLIGGCDGAKPGRNYYTELAEKVPSDCMILTLACGKYRFNKKDFGEIGGIPRLLDVGQCNDAYSAIKIASALAGAFNCSVNELPLSLVLSWYEQKAVVILLSLLHLGIKGIRIGPSLPAFITPNVLSFLVDNFDLKPVSNADEDLQQMLA